jgi:hypothetical protein
MNKQENVEKDQNFDNPNNSEKPLNNSRNKLKKKIFNIQKIQSNYNEKLKKNNYFNISYIQSLRNKKKAQKVILERILNDNCDLTNNNNIMDELVKMNEILHLFKRINSNNNSFNKFRKSKKNKNKLNEKKYNILQNKCKNDLKIKYRNKNHNQNEINKTIIDNNNIDNIHKNNQNLYPQNYNFNSVFSNNQNNNSLGLLIYNNLLNLNYNNYIPCLINTNYQTPIFYFIYNYGNIPQSSNFQFGNITPLNNLYITNSQIENSNLNNFNNCNILYNCLYQVPNYNGFQHYLLNINPHLPQNTSTNSLNDSNNQTL